MKSSSLPRLQHLELRGPAVWWVYWVSDCVSGIGFEVWGLASRPRSCLGKGVHRRVL